MRRYLYDRAYVYLLPGCLVVLPFVLFYRESLGFSTLGQADIISIFFPAQQAAFEQIRQGILPLWNPNMYGGMPLFASWQPAILDPLNWISFAGVTSRSLTLSQQLSYVLCLLASYAFARKLGLSRRASLVSCIVFSLNGFIVARSIYPGYVRIFALLPLLLYLIERLYQSSRWRDVGLGTLTVAWILFAGHPQPAVYALLLAGSYAIFRALHPRPEDRSTRYRIVQAGILFPLGAAVAAVQWIPAYELADASIRKQATYEFFSFQSFHPVSFFNLIIPYLHGQGSGLYKLPFWGPYWTHNEGQFYLGVLALSLALGAGIGWWNEPSRQIRFWSLAGLFSLCLAMCQYIPVLGKLLYHIPLLNSFRSPNRHWLEFSLAIAILAGFAVDGILKQQALSIAKVARFLSITLTSICAVGAVTVLYRSEMIEVFLRRLPELSSLPQGLLNNAGAEFVMAALCACILTLGICLFTGSKNPARHFPILLMLLLADYFLYATFAPIRSGPNLESLVGTGIPMELAMLHENHPQARYHLLLRPSDGEFNPFWFAGHPMTSGYDPLEVESYRTFTGADDAGRSLSLSLIDDKNQTLDLLNARYLLVPPAGFVAPQGIEKISQLDGIGFQQIQMELRSNQNTFLSADAVQADSVAIVSSLSNSIDVPEGSSVAELSIACRNEPIANLPIRAGVDTAEWAHERSDVSAKIRHGMVRAAKSWPGDEAGGFQGHSYLGKLKLERPLKPCDQPYAMRIRMNPVEGASLSISAVSLYDTKSKRSSAAKLDRLGLLRQSDRWLERNLVFSNPLNRALYGGLRVFENTRSMSGAWLTHRAAAKSDDEQLKSIRGEGDQPFDPETLTLVSPEAMPFLDPKLLSQTAPADALKKTIILEHSPNSIRIEVETDFPAMLVLSENWFPGWQARVDESEASLWRVNYQLRGVEVPRGRHRIEVFYRPASLLLGAAISLPALLIALLLISRNAFLPQAARLARRVSPVTIPGRRDSQAFPRP